MASRPRALLGLKSARIRYATSPASPAAPAGCPWPRSAVPGHRHLTEFGPVVLGDRDVDDPGRLGQVRRQRLPRVLEVLGLDVRGPGRIVAEGLGQDVLVGVIHAARPVEPLAARLGPARLGEFAGYLWPPVGVLGLDAELGGDEDHGCSL